MSPTLVSLNICPCLCFISMGMSGVGAGKSWFWNQLRNKIQETEDGDHCDDLQCPPYKVKSSREYGFRSVAKWVCNSHPHRIRQTNPLSLSCTSQLPRETVSVLGGYSVPENWREHCFLSEAAKAEEKEDLEGSRLSMFSSLKLNNPISHLSSG